MKRLILFVTGAGILMAGSAVYLNTPPPEMRKQVFTVKYGEPLRGIARNLHRKNCIRDENFFIIGSYLLRRKYVKAGRYNLHEGMSTFDILNKLTRGDVLTRSVTIPEGYNLYQIAERMEAKNITDEERFLYYAFNEDFLVSINIMSPSAEGYLFPDTYVFPEGSDPRDVIARMHNTMERVLSEISPGGVTGPREVHRLLIMASLIEEEARVPEERRYISSVFHNRIKRNMRLDCDPTVRYAVKKFTGRITYSDLKYDSPYNTYVRHGLPPTPISSPGRKSIEAALDPAQTVYLYFVARNDGSHYFSKTLKEHNRAVRYYQKGIQEGFVDNQELGR